MAEATPSTPRRGYAWVVAPVLVFAALMAVERGARIVRTHDVAATRDALLVWEAVAGPR